MTTLMEIREVIRRIYRDYGRYVLPAVRFVVFFIAASLLDSRLGYSGVLSSFAVRALLALVAAAVPTNAGCCLLMLVMLYDLRSLGMVALIIGAVVVLTLFLLYFRFSPETGILALLMPISFTLGIPYAIPVAAGLLCGPGGIFSIAAGTAVYYFLHFIRDNEAAIRQFGVEEAIAGVRFMVDGLLADKVVIVMCVTFALTLLVVWGIRRLEIAQSFLIAAVAGAIIQLIALFVGNIVYDTGVSIPGALLGTLVALVVALVIVFFFYNLDYQRTEKTQFEDDDYYYYVKAVPKLSVRERSRTVRRINTAREPMRRRAGARHEGGRYADLRYGESRYDDDRDDDARYEEARYRDEPVYEEADYTGVVSYEDETMGMTDEMVPDTAELESVRVPETDVMSTQDMEELPPESGDDPYYGE